MIRHATALDIPAINQIARQFNSELGFVSRNSLERAISNKELFVAEVGGGVAGFVNWHARRDGWQAIYELGVDRAYQGQGVGRALLYAVPCPVRLKCTADNSRANNFYRGAGMRLVGTETGRRRALNIYEMRILNIIVRGDNKDVPAICRASGSAYGVQEHDPAHAWPFMVDVDFGNPNWPGYIRTVEGHRPVQALVVDYADRELKEEMLRQVADLRAAGVLRVVVCPKFHGAIGDIPPDCVIGVSLRTAGRLANGENKFAGFMPQFEELARRRCHLLGGSPRLQKDTISKLHGIGAVVLSVDGNAQFGGAARGSMYADGRWRRKTGEKAAYLETALQSSKAIQYELNAAATSEQLPLF